MNWFYRLRTRVVVWIFWRYWAPLMMPKDGWYTVCLDHRVRVGLFSYDGRHPAPPERQLA